LSITIINEDFILKMYRDCFICSKEFFVRSDRVKTAKFCSRKCQMPWITQQSVVKMKEKWATEDTFVKLKESFDRFVVKKDGCWDWNGCKTDGYGAFRFRGKHFKAHRASWIIHNGEISEGLWVLHKCDNRGCSNPEHLFIGNALDNQRDKMSKGRGVGEKLNPDLVREIKKLLRMGVKNIRIEKDFSISESTVTSIKLGRTWKDII